MVQSVKNGLKTAPDDDLLFNSFLQRMLLSYRTIPHADRNQSPSELMGRQLRSPLTMSYHTAEKVWYRKSRENIPEQAEFIVQSRNNTALILCKGRSILAHENQIYKQPITNDETASTPTMTDPIKYETVEMPERKYQEDLPDIVKIKIA